MAFSKGSMYAILLCMCTGPLQYRPLLTSRYTCPELDVVQTHAYALQLRFCTSRQLTEKLERILHAEVGPRNVGVMCSLYPRHACGLRSSNTFIEHVGRTRVVLLLQSQAIEHVGRTRLMLLLQSQAIIICSNSRSQCSSNVFIEHAGRTGLMLIFSSQAILII